MKNILIAICLLTLTSCKWGVKRVDESLFPDSAPVVVELDRGKKLVDVDWRYLTLDNQAQISTWYLLRDMTDSDTAITYEYTNGTNKIIIIEREE